MKREKIFKECYLRNGGMLLQRQMFLFKGKSNPIRIFTARDLEKLTNNYTNQAEKNQANPTTFKGILDDREVIVKRTFQREYFYLEPAINELAVLSSIHHKNIVKLLGCCLETEFPMLVYEFIPNGTLSEHIHLLSWKHRLRVATEIASAISYLHCGAPTPIVHMDLKPQNVMLDENGTAKVIGFSNLMPIPVGKTSVESLGYLDPECMKTGLLTEKSDVYSFGVILHEFLMGRTPISHPDTFSSLVDYFVTHVEEGGRLVAPEYAMMGLLTEKSDVYSFGVILFELLMGRSPIWGEYFDAYVEEGRLVDVIDVGIYDEGTMEQFQAFAEVAMKCVRPESEGRPTMMEVTQELRVIRRLAP